MTACLRQVTALTWIAICLAVLTGCGVKTAGRSNLSTTIGDRQVKASLEGNGSITSQDGAAVINFGGGKLVVEKASLKLNDKELATLPEKTKLVEIDYTAGTLSIRADGEPIALTQTGT